MNTFNAVGHAFSYDDELLTQIEKFVCHLYNQANTNEVNKARLNIFRLGLFNEESMPCTKDVLMKHLSRSNYQAAIWRRALHPIIAAPNIVNHGWAVVNGIVSIQWMDLPSAPDGILENVHCGCKSGCLTNRCSCYKGNLCCTVLCHCSGCDNCSEPAEDGSENEEEDHEVDEEDSDYDDY